MIAQFANRKLYREDFLESTLITVAPTGAEIDKGKVPTLPTTPEEIIQTAIACEAAGAAMVHVHVRDKENRPSLDLGLLTEVVSGLREETNLLVQLSTGGGVDDSYDDRLRVLDASPDSCSLTMGTVNFGNDVFCNPWPFIIELYQRAKDLEVVPEFEIFDLGHLASVPRILDKLGLPFGGVVHCNFVLGVPGGAPGSALTLAGMVGLLPLEVKSWSASGIGRASLPVMMSAIAMGGHLRVGMEDTVHYAAGRRVEHNAELVERASQLANLAQRPAMPVNEARKLLNVA